ncbi:S9 family peptidase [Steroidobacter sp.]|uniref:S9 family peptidase n=1 Tax=Steroidobacter sp. TaxID=1978227 RepID=UPI001A5018CD|nr:DPP IV N-terminal domain-containing protein [Steroidobacter sp.]MBL8271571.1 DPP IV N-terminal domain-containing protein [Steroidobacter sp.]
MKRRVAPNVGCWAGLWLLLALSSATASVEGDEDLRRAYARAEALLPWNIGAELYGVDIQPNWIGTTDQFWYRLTNVAGSEFVLIDAARNTRRAAFDHARLAQSLSRLVAKPFTAQQLPFTSFEYREGLQRIRLSVDGRSVECDLIDYACAQRSAPQALLPGEMQSPDGNWAAFVREHDLYVRSLRDDRQIRLTEDGAEHYGYGQWPESHLLSVTAKLSGQTRPVRVLWSPDSKKLVSYRVDERAVEPMPFVQWVPEEGYGSRPKVHWARVPLPADERVTTASLVIFELLPAADAPVRRIDVQAEPIPVNYDLVGNGSWWGQLWWDAASRRVYHVREERGFRDVSIHVTDASTGVSRVLLQETGPTYVVIDAPMLPRGMSGTRLHWLSSRSGWQHLYRYDLQTGKLLSQVTDGDWHVQRIEHVTSGEGWVYFTAGGRESNLDPYYLQLYRARPDGSRIERLTPEDSFHEVSFSPSGRYFVDRHSRADLPPTTVLRRADGRLVRVVEQADIRALMSRGWQKPERFKAKGRDGVTDIYGTLFRPSNFDAGKRYPVLDDIYGGPQGTYADPRFSAGSPLAELGFINVRIDGMGTPGRSKAFHDVSYGEGFAEAGGLEDHIAVLRQLATRYSYMDLDRVGIYGHSAGGYASTRALLDHPEFYKVGVSSAGSHDQRLYLMEWGERFIGRPAWNPAAYQLQANSQHVQKFQGKLLLAHGALDDDVPIVNTMQLVDALIAANKDVDLLIIPGVNHGGMGRHPYFIRRRWDYFVRHLMQRQPPAGYEIGAKQ